MSVKFEHQKCMKSKIILNTQSAKYKKILLLNYSERNIVNI